MKRVTAIARKTLRMILEASRDMYPREFGAILRAEEGIITELILVKDELRDDALLGSEDRAKLARIHVAGRLQDHPQGLAGDGRHALHRTSSLPGQLRLYSSVDL